VSSINLKLTTITDVITNFVDNFLEDCEACRLRDMLQALLPLECSTIIIIIIIIIITCMHGIYNYIPETNHVSSVHSVTAVLYLQSVLHVMLFRP
jgi:hypothetical protein